MGTAPRVGLERTARLPGCVGALTTLLAEDDEGAGIARLLAPDAVDLELKMLSLVARCEGGMRTGDLHACDWTMVDLAAFATCTIPRRKMAAPEVLDVPEMLRVARLFAAGDTEGARVAGDAMMRLLTSAPSDGAPAVDLEREREMRGR